MDDPALIRELHYLGVDQHTWPVLALLPLIQVAWADGEVQEAERAMILDVAEREFMLDERGKKALTNWLTHAPTEQYLRRGRDAARLLTERNPDIASAHTVLEHCEAVARAAGGLFGFRAIDAREQAVLDELAEVLHMPTGQDWDWATAMQEELDAEEAVQKGEEEDDEDEPTGVFDLGAALLESNARVAAVEVLEMGEADEGDDDDAPRIQCTFQPAEAPEIGAPELERLDTGDRFAMPPAGLSIGRSRTNDLWVRDDAMVSRKHCLLYVDDVGHAHIVDYESTTGTHVNGERVVTRVLFGGEQLVVGQLEFRVHWTAPAG